MLKIDNMDQTVPRSSPTLPLHAPSSPPLSPTASPVSSPVRFPPSITVTFPPGPLGIEFDWNETYNRFSIKTLNNTKAGSDTLHAGLLLTHVNNDELPLSYDGAVEILKGGGAVDGEERNLTFNNSRNLEPTDTDMSRKCSRGIHKI